jgi:hypothetical protein
LSGHPQYDPEGAGHHPVGEPRPDEAASAGGVNRRTVYRRDNDTCQYCGRQFPTEELSIDHVVPKCQGGQSTFENCVIACVSCNAKKAGRTPKQANMKLIRQPERPKAAVFEADIVCDSWSAFMDACYWAVPLID